ncbi:MAG TPA: ABC transporter ATP-binding protein [Actinomycetota bacterium]|nr:ABC transporter ATP-binding protein [Actinomycetota bacterium]
MSAVVKFRGVGVMRSGSIILANVNWRVEEGQRWVVLGPNGAGKSTLMNLASSRMHPSVGRVSLLGSRLGRVDVFELRPRIGLASDSIADQVPGDEVVLDAVMTAAWAITGRWRESYEDQDLGRGQELLSSMGIAHLAERRFDSLSEGEAKRVIIARALMTDPELLLLDEPAAGLDLGGREELVARLSTLAQDPKAPVSVMVTHHVEEIPIGTTHVMLMREGRVVAQGPIGETLTSARLSESFGIPLEVTEVGRRWAARAW